VADNAGMRIVVGIDGSKSSLHATDWAGDYAAGMGLQIELVSIWSWPNSYGWAIPLPDGYNPASDAERVLAESAGRLAERHPSVPVTSTVVEGHAAQVLVELSQDAALLVVGSRGHGEFSGMLIGSVSEHCAAQAQCPVLVFHGPHTKGD
jgi:nucleotide-binding universal stress UspA family protein